MFDPKGSFALQSNVGVPVLMTRQSKPASDAAAADNEFGARWRPSR
jgi:hypothetical protein